MNCVFHVICVIYLIPLNKNCQNISTRKTKAITISGISMRSGLFWKMTFGLRFSFALFVRLVADLENFQIQRDALALLCSPSCNPRPAQRCELKNGSNADRDESNEHIASPTVYVFFILGIFCERSRLAISERLQISTQNF